MPVYLLLDAFTLFFPLVFSFDSKVRFSRYWRYFFAATVFPAAFFIVWDYTFTQRGIWGFNSQYLVGIDLGILPLEEILFFVVVPFACVFIYESLRSYIKQDYLGKVSKQITVALLVVLAIATILNPTKTYTVVTFGLVALLLLLLQFVVKVNYMGWFYLAYLVHLIPFLLFNGVLTALPVVQYNNTQNLGIRLYTIPVEDTMYSMLLLLMNIALYEWLKSRNSPYKPATQPTVGTKN